MSNVLYNQQLFKACTGRSQWTVYCVHVVKLFKACTGRSQWTVYTVQYQKLFIACIDRCPIDCLLYSTSSCSKIVLVDVQWTVYCVVTEVVQSLYQQMSNGLSTVQYQQLFKACTDRSPKDCLYCVHVVPVVFRGINSIHHWNFTICFIAKQNFVILL